MYVTYNTIEEAVKDLKLDRRRKYGTHLGELIYSIKYTAPCSGCSCDCSDGYGCNHGNAGCQECGYKGKRIDYAPVPIQTKEGHFVKILTSNT